MIVTRRQFSEFLAEPFAAGIVFPAGTVTVTTPVTERPDNTSEQLIIGDNGSTFTSGDVVSRVKRNGCKVPECPGVFSMIFTAECIAVIFDQPQVIFVCNSFNSFNIKRITQCMSEKDSSGF